MLPESLPVPPPVKKIRTFKVQGWAGSTDPPARAVSLSQTLVTKHGDLLSAVLGDDEEILDAAAGWYGKAPGILVATQKRVAVFVDKELKVEFSLDKIIRIQYEDARFLLGTLTIFASDHKAIIENGLRTNLRAFSEGFRAAAALAVTSEAEKLGELKELGSTPEQTTILDARPTTTGSRRRTA